MNRAWIDAQILDSYEIIDTHPAEPNAANGLRIGSVVVFPSRFPRTAERLSQRGVDVVPIDLSELAKAEGAVTCCSLVFSGEKKGA